MKTEDKIAFLRRVQNEKFSISCGNLFFPYGLRHGWSLKV